jgi:hypothetical protein
MGLHWSQLPKESLALLRRGCVIPAHPLALDAKRRFDALRQRALTRYYIDAGSGGLAVGVHATQFAIRDKGLYEPVLQLAADAAREWAKRPLFMIAGLAGKTVQAKKEAEIAVAHGYHAGMLSLGAMKGASTDELVTHCAAVAKQLPLVGFYLQTAVGGIPLSAAFWRRFAGDRERDRDQDRTVQPLPHARCRARRCAGEGGGSRDALYRQRRSHRARSRRAARGKAWRRGGRVRIQGGLLGHWSVWTKKAVGLHERIQAAVASAGSIPICSRSMRA